MNTVMESYTNVESVVSIKLEPPLICVTCLSKDRDMTPLGSNKHIFQKLYEKHDTMSLDDALLCWECHAVLNKVTKFVNKANRAEYILANCKTYVNSLSSLKSVQCDEFIEIRQDNRTLNVKDDFGYLEILKSDCDNDNSNKNENLIDDKTLDSAITIKREAEKFEEIVIDISFENECTDNIIDYDITAKCPSFGANVSRNGDLNKCEECGKKFKYNALLMKHKMIHKEVECDVCHLKLQGKWHLRAHKLSTHGAVKQHNQGSFCEDCNIQFKTARGFKTHLKTSANHSATNGNSYKEIGFAPGAEIKTISEENAAQSLETKDETYSLHDNNKTSSSDNEYNDSLTNTDLGLESRFATVQMSEEEMRKVRKQMRESRKYVKSNYKCELCIVGFKRKYLYDLHYTEKHLEKLGEPCPICQVRYLSEELGPHQRGHYTLYQCDMCQYRNPDLGAMQQHHSLRHATRVGDKLQTQYKCKHCPHLPVFKSRASYSYHRRSKHSVPKICQTNVPKSPKVECDLCHKMLGAKCLSTHKRLVHKSVKEEGAFCIECNKQFKHMASYNAHLMLNSNHTSSSSYKYECEICKKKFSHYLLVNSHRNRVHLRLGEKCCHLCDKKFITRTALNKHVTVIHEGKKEAKDHKCVVCERMFSKQLLKQHMNTHTGDRPYHCQLCADTFAQKSTLYMHNRLVHLKLKKNRKPAKSKEG